MVGFVRVGAFRPGELDGGHGMCFLGMEVEVEIGGVDLLYRWLVVGLVQVEAFQPVRPDGDHGMCFLAEEKSGELALVKLV